MDSRVKSGFSSVGAKVVVVVGRLAEELYIGCSSAAPVPCYLPRDSELPALLSPVCFLAHPNTPGIRRCRWREFSAACGDYCYTSRYNL